MYHRDYSIESKLSILDFNILKKLGTGSFGVVNLVVIKKSSLDKLKQNNPIFHAILTKYKQFALKELSKRKAKFHNQTKAIHSEVNILKKLSSVQFPSKCEQSVLLSSFQDKFNYYILTDYKQHSVDLFDLLNYTKLPVDLSIYLLYLFINYTKTLHASGILHGDIKPENIIISEGGRVSFIDFGTAKKLFKKHTYIYNVTNLQTDHHKAHKNRAYNTSEKTCRCINNEPNLQERNNSAIKGSIQFLPPEVLSKESNRNIYTDLWSVGITMFYIIFKRLPFNQKTDYLTIQYIIDQDNEKIDGLIENELSKIYGSEMNKAIKEREILKKMFGILLNINFKQRKEINTFIKKISDTFIFKEEKKIKKCSEKMDYYLLMYRTIKSYQKDAPILVSGECVKKTWWGIWRGFVHKYIFWINLEQTLFIYNLRKDEFKEVVKRDDWEIKDKNILIKNKNVYKVASTYKGK